MTSEARLVIATPLATPMIHMLYVASVQSVLAAFPSKWMVVRGPYLPHNRGQLAADIINEEDATHALFVDSDIVFNPSHVQALVDLDVDLAAGAYAMKDGSGAVVADPLAGDTERLDGSPVKVRSVGFGFVLMKRDALSRMAAKYSDLIYEKGGTKYVDLFAPQPGTPETEDYAFCRRWRSMGGDVVLHGGVRLAHIGEKRYLPASTVG